MNNELRRCASPRRLGMKTAAAAAVLSLCLSVTATVAAAQKKAQGDLSDKTRLFTTYSERQRLDLLRAASPVVDNSARAQDGVEEGGSSIRYKGYISVAGREAKVFLDGVESTSVTGSSVRGYGGGVDKHGALRLYLGSRDSVTLKAGQSTELGFAGASSERTE